MSSWRTTTKKQYQTYYKKWQKFTCERQIDSLHPPLNQVLDFLEDLFESGLSYSALNTARSALSTFISVNNVPVGSHPYVKRFMKGVFEQRPSVSRYTKTWDVSLVLNFLWKWATGDFEFKKINA